MFLGHEPQHWEDRLIIKAILDKRPPQAELSYAVQQDADQFTSAYWHAKGIKRYAVPLPEFVGGLGRFLQACQ